MLDPDSFRSALGRFASGVTVVTARDEKGVDHGMTVSAFCSVSLVPPLVIACIGHDASMHEVLSRTACFGVNILSAEQEALSRRFSAPESDRFEGVGFTRGDCGVALLDEALAHLECQIVSRHEAGDHTLVIAQVDRVSSRVGQPLLYFRGGYAQLAR